jgi:hypothetical protein
MLTNFVLLFETPQNVLCLAMSKTADLLLQQNLCYLLPVRSLFVVYFAKVGIIVIFLIKSSLCHFPRN